MPADVGRRLRCDFHEWIPCRRTAPKRTIVSGDGIQETAPISIPMIADGAVQGYVVAELGYTYDQNAKAPIPPDAYLLDETFRKVYSDTTIDFRHLEKYDVNGMTKDLARRVNERLHAAVVKDVLVQAMNFVPKSDIPK